MISAVVLVLFPRMVTVAGAEIIVLSNGVNVTTTPLLGAAVPMETVTVPEALENKFKGLGVSVIAATAVALIVTVAGELFSTPSFTMS